MKEKSWRPPVSGRRKAMLERIRDKMNEDALIPFTLHNIHDLVVDRAYQAMFPDDKNMPKRKKYIKIDF